ncbi:hypothetical protein P170DRAFT_436395 [Aspergillus steynii IBT 23096]|uniref:Prolyl 4-hydroxylase alpha subunit domain-containing protein n=1 Tax=Aspergillus steynii IBT 23096 TaxID=1392250 RepID=A0A2I2GEQ8_9EURO|nr:uncharacterized protein P170DRAFT_436395 [Aspergillus steynii IBT 23096]PLB51376.1 hypothetical protein P170DRAFT_436395 [Aspergillus steynii IBT 23096]
MASIQIPPDFLKGECPSASLRRLDFMQTLPPIPAFKDHFAAVVDDLLTPDECQHLLRLVEGSTLPTNQPSAAPTWHRAMVNGGNGKQDMAVDTRNCGRIIWDTPEIADRLFRRLRPFLKECEIDTIQNQPLVTGRGPAKRQEEFQLSRLNERIRFLRYKGGEYFRPHWDGNYVTEDGNEMSLFTVHLYLNGTGEQDVEELERRIEESERETGLLEEDGEIELGNIAPDRDNNSDLAESSDESSNDMRTRRAAGGGDDQDALLGGATSFSDGFRSKGAVRVFPRAGSVLIFQQRNLFHGGDDVFCGVKYTARTDVMYRKAAKE